MKTIIKTVNLFLKPFKKKIEFVDFLVRTLDIEIVHSPYQFIPKTTKAKLICTMHDVQELHFPEFFSAAELESRAINYTDFIKRADAIVVSFNHVKHDIVRFFKTKEEKIYTILVGINSLWIVDYFNSKRKISCETKFEIFLLYPANSWKHKNHLGLLEALKILKEDIKENLLYNDEDEGKMKKTWCLSFILMFFVIIAIIAVLLIIFRKDKTNYRVLLD
jgi:hypothetical protein